MVFGGVRGRWQASKSKIFQGGPKNFDLEKLKLTSLFDPEWSVRRENKMTFSFLPLRKNLFQSGSKLRSQHKNVFETF